MKILTLSILFVFLNLLAKAGGGGGPVSALTSVAKTNELITEAEASLRNRDYKTAISKYGFLIDSLKLKDEQATMNLAHAYFQEKNFEKASEYYNRLTGSENAKLRSNAWNQLGVLAQGNREEALESFRKALKADPSNENARYNYELTKNQPKSDNKNDKDKNSKNDKDKKDNKDNKDNKENKENKPDNKNGNQDKKDGKTDDKKDGKDKKDNGKDGQKNDQDKKGGKDKDGDKKDSKGDKKDENKGKDGQDKDNKNGENGKGEQPDKGPEAKNGQGKQPAISPKNGVETDKKNATHSFVNKEKLAKMNLSEDQAVKLLDAMKSNEVQYLQQRQHTSTPRNTDKGKPDW